VVRIVERVSPVILRTHTLRNQRLTKSVIFVQHIEKVKQRDLKL
jgi:hypothetical protein